MQMTPPNGSAGTKEKNMKLQYDSEEHGVMTWPVEELISGTRFKLLDDTGKPCTSPVSVTVDRAFIQHFYDGFVVEGGDVYAISLLTDSPKTHVGRFPRLG